MRMVSRILVVLAWCVAAFAVLLAAIAVATAFPAGRAAIAALATAVISATTEIDVEVEDVHRLTPAAVDIGHIRVDIGGERIASADGLHLRLRWADLLRGRIRPAALHVEQLAIEALPADDREEDAPAGFRIELPLLPAESIHVDRLSLAEAVLGEAAAFRISATEIAADAHAIDVALQRLDRPGDGLTLRARYRPEAMTLELRAEAAEAAGGLIARQLGAGPDAALRAELAGAGPIDGWRGRLTAAVDGIASIEADLGIDKGVGAVIGEARIEPALVPDLAALLRDPINYRARIHWSQVEGLRIDSGRIRVADIAVGLAGMVAPDFTDIQVQLSADLPLATVGSLIDMPMQGSAGILLHVAGAPTRPAIAGDLALSDPRIGSIGTANGLLRLEARPERGGGYRIELAGNVAGLAGVPNALMPLLTGRIDLETVLDISAGAEEIQLRRLSLQGSALTAQGEAVLRPDGGESRGQFSLHADMSAGAGPVTGGEATLELTGTADLASGSYRAEANLVAERLAVSEIAAGRLLGTVPRLVLTIAGARGAPLRIEQARAVIAAGNLGANGTLDTAGDSLDLDLTAEIPDLALLSGLVGEALAGGAALTAHLTGPTGDPAARGELVVRELALGTRHVDRGELSFDLRQLVSEPQGPLEARIHTGGADYRLAADMRLRNRVELDLAKLVAAAPGIAANGDLVVDVARGLARGRVNVNAADLVPASSLAGLSVAGSGQAGIRLTTADGRQQVAAEIKADGLHVAEMAFGLLEGRIAVSDALGTPRGEVSLSGRDAVTAAATLKRWQLAARGDLARASFDMSLSGEAGAPISARASGHAGVNGPRWQVSLRGFEARHGDIDVRLDGATELRGEPGALRLAATEMIVGRTRLSLGGGMANGQVDGHLRTGAFPLSLLRTVQPDLPLRGHVEIDLSASGPAAAPRIAGTMRSKDLRLRRSDATVAMDLEIALAEGRLAGRATIGNLADQPLVATLAAPLRLGLAPWRLDWSPDGPIEGRLDGKVDLARVLPPLIPDGDEVRGIAHVQIALGGTLARPVANGAAKLSGGRYENAVTEAVIADLSLELVANGGNIAVSARGTDGESGRATLEGSVNLDRADQPIAGTMELSEFWVARRADASVRMAGDLGVSGTVGAPHLAGRLAVLQADLQLPEQLPPEVVKLDVVEINLPPDRRAPAAVPPESGGEGAIQIGLDLTVTADRRVFVRGRGLQSEWSGNVHIRGSTAAPEVSGTLQALNGHLDFIGQRFVLSKGRLLFPGGARINPDLDIVTELTRGDITAVVTVAGTLESPLLSLGARPDMPPEEVISRMLFDRGTARLSPLQAVQVAQAALSLVRGGSGSAGMLDRIRRTTGLDVLDFEAGGAEGEAGAVSVGKYVSDNVLIRAEKGLDNTGPRAGIEVEVTPNVSVESTVGANAATSVGVKVKKDY